MYSLSKLVADVKSQSSVTTGGGARSATTFPKTQVSRSKEVNRLAALTKTTTSIKRMIPTAREVKKGARTQEQDAKKTNELRAQDYWDRFRESKLEKMRQHKLNVEQRMRDNGGVGDNYSYYWDNINHCYSDQTNSKYRNHQTAAQNKEQAADHSLPASWYTDNIYSNWSIDLDEEDIRQRNDNAQRGSSGRRRRGARSLNSCDINGNSPYKVSDPNGFHATTVPEDVEVCGDSEPEDEDVFNNNNRINSHLVDRYCVHLKPTTPTKYAQSNRSNGAFVNSNASGAAPPPDMDDEDDFETLFHAGDNRNSIRRVIPKSKSFGLETTRVSGGSRFGLGAAASSFLWPGRRSKTTNLLMDIQSRLRREGANKQQRVAEDGPSLSNTTQRNRYYPGNPGGGAGDEFERWDRRPRNRSIDDDFCHRRSRFDFHHNLLLNSEDEEEQQQRMVDADNDGGESDFGFHPLPIDYNNNLQRGLSVGGRDMAIGDPSEAYYHHQEAINRPPIRPASLNLSSQQQRFTRGRSLDDYEYGASSSRARNMNFIDKNLNIVNFLNSARNIPQEFHADVGVREQLPVPEMAPEQIFNPNLEYRQQPPLKHAHSTKGSKMNRLRNFSSLDLDWESEGTKGHQGILERTSAIFGHLINSPQSTSSFDDIAMIADNDDLNFISDPEPMPKKSCMKKTSSLRNSDFILHHPQQELDYKLNTFYPQEEFNDPPQSSLLARHEVIDSHHHHLDSFHLANNCCGPLDNNSINGDSRNLDATNGNLPLLGSEVDEEEDQEDLDADEEKELCAEEVEEKLDPNTLHIINNIFSIYKPSQYSPVNCHNPTQENVKGDSYCKKISLPSTMRPLGDHAMPGQSKIDMDDDCYLVRDQNNNHVIPHDAYDDCFVEGPSAILGGNRRRKSTFFASLKRPLMVVKSKSCHDSVATSDDHWFCSGDLPGKWHKDPLSSSTNLLNALTSPTDSHNSSLEKAGLFKFSPTSTTETSYFYPFDYYFNAAAAASPSSAVARHYQHHQNTGTKKKSLIKLRSTTRPLSFSH